MDDREFSYVLALARCGIAHEVLSEAYLHQLKRLSNLLSGEQAEKLQALLEWHRNGRVKSPETLVQSSQPPTSE